MRTIPTYIQGREQWATLSSFKKPREEQKAGNTMFKPIENNRGGENEPIGSWDI